MSLVRAHPGRPDQRRQAPTGIVYTLHPGDVACGDAGDRLETLLGSCVAIVLTDPRRTIGVMCHIVHSGKSRGGVHKSGAHAVTAFETMFALLSGRGITPAFCEAYVYGGGNMFPDLITTTSVGDNNACWALDALADAGIRVLCSDVGGTSYRRLSWIVGTNAPQVTAVQV